MRTLIVALLVTLLTGCANFPPKLISGDEGKMIFHATVTLPMNLGKFGIELGGKRSDTKPQTEEVTGDP